MSEAWKPELDLVRQNRELTFPPNVSLKFVFWPHRTANIPQIIPYLRDCDIVAIETGHYQGSDKTIGGAKVAWDSADHFYENVVRAYNYANLLTGAWQEEHDRAELKDVAKEDEYVLRIASHLEDSRIFFTPLDDWDQPITMSSEPNPVVAKELNSASRENVSLRKLAALANKYADAEQTVTIGVLYGGAHTLLEVAAKQLGASTERAATVRYSDFGPVTPDMVLSRLIRFGKYASTADLSQREAEVFSAAEAFWYTYPGNARNVAVLIKRLGQLSQDDQTWHKFQSILSEFTNAEFDAKNSKHLRGLKERRAAKHLETLKGMLGPYVGEPWVDLMGAKYPHLVP